MSHIEKVGVRELRQNASAVLRRVKAGETLEITERGCPVARLVPIKRTWLEQMIAEGRVRPATETWAASMRKHPPLPLKPGERPLSEILREMRDEDER